MLYAETNGVSMSNENDQRPEACKNDKKQKQNNYPICML